MVRAPGTSESLLIPGRDGRDGPIPPEDGPHKRSERVKLWLFRVVPRLKRCPNVSKYMVKGILLFYPIWGLNISVRGYVVLSKSAGPPLLFVRRAPVCRAPGPATVLCRNASELWCFKPGAKHLWVDRRTNLTTPGNEIAVMIHDDYSKPNRLVEFCAILT